MTHLKCIKKHFTLLFLNPTPLVFKLKELFKIIYDKKVYKFNCANRDSTHDNNHFTVNLKQLLLKKL